MMSVWNPHLFFCLHRKMCVSTKKWRMWRQMTHKARFYDFKTKIILRSFLFLCIRFIFLLHCWFVCLDRTRPLGFGRNRNEISRFFPNNNIKLYLNDVRLSVACLISDAFKLWDESPFLEMWMIDTDSLKILHFFSWGFWTVIYGLNLFSLWSLGGIFWTIQTKYQQKWKSYSCKSIQFASVRL